MALPTIAGTRPHRPQPTGSALRFAGLLTAIGALALAAFAAHAQTGAEVPRPRAAVFDFTDPAGWPGRLVGWRAAEAVQAALAAADHWDLADRGVIVRACADQGLEPPFGIGYLQMLGDRLGTPLAVSGMVEVCEVNPARRVAQVTLVAELVETGSGAGLRSVRGVASASARDEVLTLDQLVDRALVQAAGDLVRALTNFEPTSATVVTTLPDRRVVLDAPERPGLRPGDVLLAFAGERPAGLLRVQSMKLTVVHAQVLTGEDFRGGQRAVLVAR